MKTSTKILMPMLLIGIGIMILAFVALFKEGKPYTTKVKVYSKLEPDIHKYSADYPLSIFNYEKNRSEVIEAEYFTWEKAKPGDEMYLTMWDYTPIHPRLNEYSGRILILGFILFSIPFAWFMHKGLTGDNDW